MRIFFFLSALLLLALPGESLSGWGGGDCGPVGLPVFVSSEQGGYRWVRSDSDPDCWGLLLNGLQVGGWRQSTGEYRSLGAGGWGGWSSPPVTPPLPATAKKKADCPCCGENCNCAVRPCGKPDCKCVLAGSVVESDGTLNFGLNRAEIERRPRRIHNGREVSREDLLSAISKAGVPDDAGELCLTVIGPESERQRVLSDLASSAALAPWKGKLKIQGYEPSHWAVKDSGFVTTGHPTIYCQSPDGKVLHRADEYAGPEALAEALRQADPAYNPGKDPNLNNPLGGSLDGIVKQLESVPGWVWVAAMFALYLRFGKKV